VKRRNYDGAGYTQVVLVEHPRTRRDIPVALGEDWRTNLSDLLNEG
jgi:hypothetical protein